MLIDGRMIEGGTTLDADVCIVGGGFAGLTLCRKLVAAGLDVIVLESGDAGAHACQTGLISGVNEGTHHFALGGMRRQLAGGVNDWGANCALADERDFRPAQSGQRDWPFGRDELSKYADEALMALGVEDERDRQTLATAKDRIALPDGVQITARPFVKGDQALGGRLAALVSHRDFAARVITCATVLSFSLSDGDQSVEAVSVTNGSQHFTVKARTFVLSAGLENAAILLRGLADTPDAVMARWPAMGRGLHAHLLTLHGLLLPQVDWAGFADCALPNSLKRGEDQTSRFWGLDLAATKGEGGLLNGLLFFAPMARAGLVSAKDVRRAKRRLGLRRYAFWRRPPLMLRHYIEQPARWDSRVTLGGKSGPLNLAVPQYHWRAGQREWDKIIDNCDRLGVLCRNQKLGQVIATLRPADITPAHLHPNAHPSGGTMMGHDPKTSVVDPDLRLHGLSNLYVCGGSVIPRGGTTMVTGIIAQLALRLASHLLSRRDAT